ncbi:MAG: Glutamine--fructose-6-phosphate aminotransferase [isomerizing] [SAR116 cluster bacterium MED-G04]|nr:MAG: Glutamine--fructose-6-phosphate aminotransferase [isomerizing] [SAR116 cluster bacterium MED-G04]|tara:strand:- start:1462 stop:2358 length:897 start_codon:yes stop_codon:yes gene_type:complete
MCGIVGLFIKDPSLQPSLGTLLTEMLITMSDRGPDSAGIAIYGQGDNDTGKITLQSQTPEADFPGLAERITETLGIVASLAVNDTHAVLSVPAEKIHTVREALTTICPSIRVMSSGNSIEIYKEVGMPVDVANRFSLSAMTGTHGIGHTRMATESAVTTMGAHPYSTGADQCLVHNGSLSNHNSLRRKLVRAGVNIETDNDSEVAAAYLTNKMELGASLGDALENALDDLDGFYTFVVGTRDGFAVLRDPIACKPAVMAETDQYVAFGSEYRALVDLPGIDTARVWEPEPATVYFWKH